MTRGDIAGAARYYWIINTHDLRMIMRPYSATELALWCSSDYVLLTSRH